MRFSHNNYSNWNICPLISLFARDANASYEPLLIWDFSYHQDTERIFDNNSPFIIFDVHETYLYMYLGASGSGKEGGEQISS